MRWRWRLSRNAMNTDCLQIENNLNNIVKRFSDAFACDFGLLVIFEFSDMSASSQFVVGLALCTFGSICCSEMCGDLINEIERLINSGSVYIKKKVILCGSSGGTSQLATIVTPRATKKEAFFDSCYRFGEAMSTYIKTSAIYNPAFVAHNIVRDVICLRFVLLLYP